jgi:tRNA-dihydrouridine synthase
MTISLKIYQAPLQGFTDWVFRRTFHEVWGGVDRFFIPYICYGKGHEIKRSQLRDVVPEHNGGMPVVPQVFFRMPPNNQPRQTAD